MKDEAWRALLASSRYPLHCGSMGLLVATNGAVFPPPLVAGQLGLSVPEMPAPVPPSGSPEAVRLERHSSLSRLLTLRQTIARISCFDNFPVVLFMWNSTFITQ